MLPPGRYTGSDGDEDIVFLEDEEGSGGPTMSRRVVRDDEESARYPTRGEGSEDDDAAACGRKRQGGKAARAPTAGAEGCDSATKAHDKQCKRGVGERSYAVGLSFAGAVKPCACCKRIQNMCIFFVQRVCNLFYPQDSCQTTNARSLHGCTKR
jgi:hypothetical protein